MPRSGRSRAQQSNIKAMGAIHGHDKENTPVSSSPAPSSIDTSLQAIERELTRQTFRAHQYERQYRQERRKKSKNASASKQI
jgi:predicted alpha/beta-hydrolase family hydrolase